MNSPPNSANTSGSPSSLANNPLLLQLAREKGAISSRLTITILALYFGFVVLLAFAPQVLAGRVGNATLGIPLGIGIIVAAWLLTGVYVRWANTRHDALVAQILSSENGEA
jgi:uncharacterized membrane protein (DUF485 family)